VNEAYKEKFDPFWMIFKSETQGCSLVGKVKIIGAASSDPEAHRRDSIQHN